MDIESIKVTYGSAVSQALLGKVGIQVVIEDSDPGTQYSLLLPSLSRCS